MGPRERVYTADDGQDAIGLETEVALSFPCSLATCAPASGPCSCAWRAESRGRVLRADRDFQLLARKNQVRVTDEQRICSHDIVVAAWIAVVGACDRRECVAGLHEMQPIP